MTEAQGCWLGQPGANFEELLGSVDLPQGAEITGFWASIFDNTASGDVIIELRSNNPSGTDEGDRVVGSGASTVDSTDYQTVSVTIDPPEVVGSQSEGGGLIFLGGPETFYFDAYIDEGTRICGLQVNYRIPASGDDLVFTPLEPCTIYDSRVSKGGPGPFATGEQRDFDVAGAIDLSSQGGPVGGCGIPAWVGGFFGQTAQAQALAVNVIAVNPTGLGSVKVWAGQQMIPDEGALLAYTGSDTFVSSAGIVPLRESCSTFPTNFCISAKDMSVKVGASTEVKIVVTGYFTDPPRLTD